MLGVALSLILLVRVFTLVLYIGMLLLYFVLVLPFSRKLPPTHRGAIVLPLLQKTAYISFAVLIALSLAGLAYAQQTGLLIIKSFPTNTLQALLIGEILVNGSMFLSAAAVVVILRVRRNLLSQTSMIESRIDDAKWFKFDGASRVLKITRRIEWIFLFDLLAGFLLIIFGAAIQQLQ
jgi:hypothetical protein